MLIFLCSDRSVTPLPAFKKFSSKTVIYIVFFFFLV
jgi:hypothetical protein